MLRHSNDDRTVEDIAEFLKTNPHLYRRAVAASKGDRYYFAHILRLIRELVKAGIVPKPITRYDQHEIADAIQDAFYAVTPYDESVETDDEIRSIGQLKSSTVDILAYWQNKAAEYKRQSKPDAYRLADAEGRIEAYNYILDEFNRTPSLEVLEAQQEQSMKFWKGQAHIECFKDPNDPVRWGIAEGNYQAREWFLLKLRQLIEWGKLLSE